MSVQNTVTRPYVLRLPPVVTPSDPIPVSVPTAFFGTMISVEVDNNSYNVQYI